jgi:thiol-disulfide isomerase/thioredoxin
MIRAALSLLLLVLVSVSLRAQEPNDLFSQALAQGDLYQSKKKFDLALDAYHKADKLCHHSSAPCYMKIASIERKLGDFSNALEDAKRAEKVAADNKTVAIQAHLFRATLLTQMSGKPGDKKLKEAEEELRQSLVLDSTIPLTHFNLGVVLLKQERDPEGLAEMNTYVAMPNADPATVVEARRIIASPIRARAPFAPDFSFTTHENENLSNAALRGKVVLLDFWGTWCPPCRESIPVTRNLQKKYADKNLQIVGISSDDDEDVWKTFIKAQQMTWSEYIDLSGKVQESFKIDSFPTYILLDKDGVIRYRRSGFGEGTQAELEEAIDKALKRASDPKLAAAAAADQQSSTVRANDQSASTAKPSLRSAKSETGSSANASSGISGSAVPAAGLENSSANSSGKGTANPANTPTSAFPGIEGGSVSGNVYTNPALGMTFQISAGLLSASFESLHALNDSVEKLAMSTILPQETASSLGSPHPIPPQYIFYASKRGEWDGRQINIPSVVISALPSRAFPLDMDKFKQTAANAATISGMKILGNVSNFTANKHQFFRADFERSIGALHVYQTLVQSLVGDSRIEIEINAYSTDELQQVASFLQTISIK